MGERFVRFDHLAEDSGVLTGDDRLDDKERTDHQRDGDDEVDDDVLDQAREDEAHERDACHSQRVGNLREHMVQVEAVRAGGGHDGGVGDGGAVVAHYAAGAGRGQTDGAENRLDVIVEDGDDDGSHDADGAPRGAGGEANGRADQEDHGREEQLQAPCACHGLADEDGGVHREAGKRAERPRKGQNQDRGDHLDEALRHALEGFLERDGTAAPEVDKREDAANHTAEGQRRAGGSVRERLDEVVVVLALCVIVAAGGDEGDNAHRNQHDHGQKQVEHGAFAGGGLFVVVCALEGTLGRGEEVALDLRVILMGQHGAVVDVQHGDDNDHQQRQQAVVVPGNLTDEHLDAADGVGVDVAGDGGGPGGYGGDHADGRGRGVDQVGQLRAGDVV